MTKKLLLNNNLLIENDSESDDNVVWSPKKIKKQTYHDIVKINENYINISIIKKNKKKQVRITFNLNVELSNKKNKLISIDLDIDQSLYFQIAKELLKP